MLVTDLAMLDMRVRGDAAGARLTALLCRLFGRRPVEAVAPFQTPLRLVAPPARDAAEGDSSPPVASAPASFPWRRHPQLLARDELAPDLSLPERRARVAAVRGMFNASSGDYEAARLAFAEAAREPLIELADVPGFWRLARAGMTAAVLAYEDVGRLRDAAALAAEINHRFRPRPIRPTPTRTPRAAATGD